MGILILVVAALAADAPQFQLDTVGGQPAAGAIVELSAQHLVLKTADGNREFKLADVRRVVCLAMTPGDSHEMSPSDAVWLQTLDGSRLCGVGYEVSKGKARLKLASGETLEVPTRWIRQVEFPAASSALAGSALAGSASAGGVADWPVAAKDATADMIVVRKKNTLDPVDGVLGDITAEGAQFSVNGESVSVKRGKIAGLIYFHPPEASELPDPACIVQELSGGRFNAKGVALVDGRLQIATSFDVTVSRPLDAIAAIDFSPSRVLYLSDLAPESAEWSPRVDNTGSAALADALAPGYRPRHDRGFDGGPLTLEGKTYKKGLALAARSELDFKLAGKGRRLQATVGIDDAVRKAGSVRLVITGDGKTLYDGKLVGRDEPAPLDIDVAGVKRLKIVVDFGGGSDGGNYLDLCDARIVK